VARAHRLLLAGAAHRLTWPSVVTSTLSPLAMSTCGAGQRCQDLNCGIRRWHGRTRSTTASCLHLAYRQPHCQFAHGQSLLHRQVPSPFDIWSRLSGHQLQIFDLSNEAERIELYEIVLTDGTAEDICRYVNREELLRLWPRLGAVAS
jgi:hypothetical protein